MSKKRSRKELPKPLHSSPEGESHPLDEDSEHNSVVKNTFQTQNVAKENLELSEDTKVGFKQDITAEDGLAHTFQQFDGFRTNVHGFLLHIAAEHGFVEMTRYLVEEGMDVLDLNAEGLQPLQLACRNGHSDVVSFLLDEMKEKSGNIPRFLLHLAAEGGHCDVIEILLKVGISVNDVNTVGDTAMHLAVIGGHEMALRTLLSHGAFFDVKNQEYRTPLDEAESKTEVILRPIQRLFTSVKKDNVDLIERNIEEGAYLNSRCSSNTTPLLLASERCSRKAVDVLLSRGADPNLAGPQGIVPLHVASSRQDGEPIVRSLLCHGAIFEALTDDGKTPLQWACDPSDCLLKTVDKIFGWLRKGKGFETRVLLCLRNMTDFEDRKAVARARDRDRRTLMAVAMRVGFSKLEALKVAVSEDYVMVDVLKAALLFKDDHRAVLKACNRLLVKTLELLLPEDPIVLEIRFVIAMTHALMGNIHEALQRHKSALKMWMKTVASTMTSSSFKFNMEGFLTSKWPEEVLWMLDGKFNWCESSSNLHDCLQFILTKAISDSPIGIPLKDAEELFGENDQWDGFKNFTFGNITKSPEQAVKYFSRSHEVFVKTLGESHPLTVRTLFRMAESLSSVGDSEGALSVYEKVLKIQKERCVDGEIDGFTSRVQVRLGLTLFELQSAMGAYLVLKEVMNRRSKNKLVTEQVALAIRRLERLLTHTVGVPDWFWQDVNDLFSNGSTKSGIL